MGKTKRGKGTKVMLVADGNGLPIGLLIESASPHEVTLASKTLDTVSVPRKRGRPRKRPKELIADKAYDSAAFRSWLRQKGIKPTIAHYERRERKKPRRGRPIKTGSNYKHRWRVERTFAWCGHFRRLLVRHERYPEVFRAFYLLAFCLILLRHF